MERIKRSWNYGTRQPQKENSEPEVPSPEPKMTLREHMCRSMERQEVFLLCALLLLIALFTFVFFNPLDNPLKDNDRYNNL